MNPASGNNNPLIRLIMVIFFLALAGSIVAGLYYGSVELPSRSLQPATQDQYVCSQCSPDLNRCTEICKANSCYTRCQAQFSTCTKSCT